MLNGLCVCVCVCVRECVCATQKRRCYNLADIIEKKKGKGLKENTRKSQEKENTSTQATAKAPTKANMNYRWRQILITGVKY